MPWKPRMVILENTSRFNDSGASGKEVFNPKSGLYRHSSGVGCSDLINSRFGNFKRVREKIESKGVGLCWNHSINQPSSGLFPIIISRHILTANCGRNCADCFSNQTLKMGTLWCRRESAIFVSCSWNAQWSSFDFELCASLWLSYLEFECNQIHHW